MESSKVIASDKATVVIQVNPQVAQDTVICDDGQQVRGAYHNTALKGFFSAQPKALGTVQIMIGVTVFLLGIVLTANVYRFDSISVIGNTYWGSFIYICTGSLSVAAQNKLNPCVVKASLGMNVISAVTAAISIILMGIEMGMLSRFPRCYSRSSYDCVHIESSGLGTLGVLLVFSILQFIVSIFISGFACKATCNTDMTVVNVALK
ncbi:membrane-spanning 4-domains subfamily A member 4A-like [Garra rufa]|uniref:membrane-spanning 4-domains subfamily A member 4A-like n=1 Tax=Garra rufa TaxID=137080 RepID=UPI003CCED271